MRSYSTVREAACLRGAAHNTIGGALGVLCHVRQAGAVLEQQLQAFRLATGAAEVCEDPLEAWRRRYSAWRRHHLRVKSGICSWACIGIAACTAAPFHVFTGQA